MYRLNLFAVLILFVIYNTYAQEKEKEETWDVSNPEGNWDFKEIKLSTNEGTWMNLDVSPDGEHITFDLLGDIYIMKKNGGNATILREGLPFEIQPRFSPDGKTISFTTYACDMVPSGWVRRSRKFTPNSV